jgi:hypothetical protein
MCFINLEHKFRKLAENHGLVPFLLANTNDSVPFLLGGRSQVVDSSTTTPSAVPAAVAPTTVAAATDWLGDADDWGDSEGEGGQLDNSNRHEDNGNRSAGSSPTDSASSPDTATPSSPLGAAGGFPCPPETRNLNLRQTGGPLQPYNEATNAVLNIISKTCAYK